MKNLKLELFNFKKSLNFDQSDIENIIEGHLNGYVEFGEKEMIYSLNERLKTYTYDKQVKSFLESLNNDVLKYELFIIKKLL